MRDGYKGGVWAIAVTLALSLEYTSSEACVIIKLAVFWDLYGGKIPDHPDLTACSATPSYTQHAASASYNA